MERYEDPMRYKEVMINDSFLEYNTIPLRYSKKLQKDVDGQMR